MGGKNRAKRQQKKKQKKAVKAAAKRVLIRHANQSVRRYMMGRRKPQEPQEAPAKEELTGVALDEQITFPHCHGVGECCKNRPLIVEPTDVWRIMHNERAREKFGLEVTMDLYPLDEKPGLLVYRVDEQSLLPFCAVYRVELNKLMMESMPDEGILIPPQFGIDSADGDQVCPFMEFTSELVPECILGEDRLTQCACDPVCRSGKLDKHRRLAGWEYALKDTPCHGCRQASEDKNREVVVRDWLEKRGMEERYIDSDLYHGFIGWVRDQIKTFPRREDHEFFWKMATSIMFDWDHFAINYLEQPKEEVLKHGPGSPKEVFLAARMMMEGIINGHKQGGTGENKSEEAQAEGEPKEG